RVGSQLYDVQLAEGTTDGRVDVASRDAPTVVALVFPEPDNEKVRIVDRAADESRRVSGRGAVEGQDDRLLRGDHTVRRRDAVEDPPGKPGVIRADPLAEPVAPE